MGREQELLEAARNGNLDTVCKILALRARRTGPLASLRRGPGANVQDSSGYTPLHHAALNGHKDIVQALLEYEASPNVPDNKGSSPLHLAAWAGHMSIVRLLLTHGPAVTNVNLTTRDNESALHCAAQYGHTNVVGMLLKHGADPTIRTSRDETALDLASQYGRLETVELLVRTHPELLEPYRSPKGAFMHTPLHRASRNGHKEVVNVLLQAGANPNVRTAAGTPLHEAALCGKTGAARALLAGGSDPRVRDARGDTVLDVLAQFPPHLTRDLVALINKYRAANGYDSDGDELPPIPVQDGLGSPYDNVRPGIGARLHHHNSTSIWERRDIDDERRVSAASNTSIADNLPQTSSSPSSNTAAVDCPKMKASDSKCAVTKPSPSKNMFVLASNCFGLRRKSSSTSNLIPPFSPFRSFASKKTPKDTPLPKKDRSQSVANISTFRMGKSTFFRRKSKESDKPILSTVENIYTEKYTKPPPPVPVPNTTDNADYYFWSESSNEDQDDESVKSSKSVKNPIYVECKDFLPSQNDSSSDEDGDDSKSSWNFIKPTDASQETPNENETREKYHVLVKTRLSKISERSVSGSEEDEQNNDTKQSTKTSLRLSHSNKTLRNWTQNQEDFKNAEPNYSMLEKPSKIENLRNSLYYALLDFSSSTSPLKHSDNFEKNHEYEPFEFHSNTEPKTFKPIEVFHENSTVFLHAEDKKLITKTIEKPNPAPRKFIVNRVSDHSVKETNENNNVNSNILFRKTSSNVATINSTRTSLESSVDSSTYRSTTSTNTSCTDNTDVDDKYLPMSSLIEFTQRQKIKFGEHDEYYVPISTLRQFRQDGPEYQNIILMKDYSKQPMRKTKSADFPIHEDYDEVKDNKATSYHIRGSSNCIYDYAKRHSIYKINPDSFKDTTVYPFIKIPESETGSDTTICFCEGKLQNDIEVQENDEYVSHTMPKIKNKKSKQRINKKGFKCYCDDADCKSHHSKNLRLSISHSLVHSMSSPHINLSPGTEQVFNINFKSPLENVTLPERTTTAYVQCSPPSPIVPPSSSCSSSYRSAFEDSEQRTSVQSLDDSYRTPCNSELWFDTIDDATLKPSDVLNVNSSLNAIGGRLLCVSSGSDGGHFPYSKSLMMDGSYHSEDLSSSYQSGRHREADQLSISSTTSSTGGPSPRERQRCGTNDSSISGSGSNYLPTMTSGYMAHSPGSNNKVSPTPPKKPPRRNLSVSPTHLLPPCGLGDHHIPHLARAHQTRSQDDLDDLQGSVGKASGLRHGRSVDQYVDIDKSPRTKPIPHPRPSLALLASGRREQPVAISTMYENVIIKEQNPKRKLRRNPRDDEETRNHRIQDRSSLESLLDEVSAAYLSGPPSDAEIRRCRNRPTIQTPLSPTHYNQPPTPEHPPPSARQAEMSIHERMRPLSQEYKRISRDMETETDPRFFGRCSSPSSSASTDHCVEEYIAEVPFAGLFKGSTTTLDGIGLRSAPAERPKTLRQLRSVYDSGGGPILPRPISNNTKQEFEDPWQYQNPIRSQEKDKDQHSHSNNNSIDKSLSILSPFDEQEEWAKISEIMASIGTRLVRESVFVDELEKEFQSRLGLSCSEASISPVVLSISSWLAGLGLPHLESNFINNGYDDVDFINGVIEDADFSEMAIEEPDKSKLLEASKTLPLKINDVLSTAPNVNHSINNNVHEEETKEEEDPEAVNKWLTSIGLECYQDTFKRHLYADMERVRRIWEVELTAVLEIQKVGHRRRILASVAGTQNGPVSSMDDIKADLNNLQKNLQNLKAEIKDIPVPDVNATPKNNPSINNTPAPASGQTLAPPPTTAGGETLKRSHKKNRPAPPPPTVQAKDLEIRAPCELLVGVPGALKTQWRHQPLSLVTSSVMYVANYLGSTVVKELRGTESTQKSIQKLKKSRNEPSALPDIILSISYRGVKFLNTITRDLVCEHEIRNIHCACQDADDLTHFAYITKDIATKSHYCHVFCVATMDQATEVILTLGQAFEVAYQMALRDLTPKTTPVTVPGQPRSQSSNQISQSKTPTHERPSKDKNNPLHGRSHSVTEIKLNGHQLKVAPITVSLSNEDFQSSARNGDTQKSPRTPSSKAPIAVTEDL